MSKEIFDSIMTGLGEAIEYERGNKNAGRSRIRETQPKIRPVKAYTKETIKNIRLSRNLSQRAFAEVIGVSCKTVEAWEAGRNHPAGSASRILEIIEKDSRLLEHYDMVMEG
jgi:putative transcriptional regulator